MIDEKTSDNISQPNNFIVSLIGERSKLLLSLKDTISESFDDIEVNCITQQSRAFAQSENADLLVVDMENRNNWSEGFIAKIKNKMPQMEVVVLTHQSGIRSALHCTRLGAEYLIKNQFLPDNLKQKVKARI